MAEEARKDGYRDLKEAAPEINEFLRMQKLREVSEKSVAQKIQGLNSIEAIAEACNASSNVREDVAFFTLGAPGLEPALLGAASVAPEGQICGPVAGEACVYVFKVSDRETGAFFTAEDAANNEKQKVQYSAQMIIPVMMEYDDVKDNRARFF